MKRMFAILGFVVLALGSVQAQVAGGLAPARITEEDAVKAVVMEAYVQGLFIKADAAAVRKGWHPACDIIQFANGSIAKVPAWNWAVRFDRDPRPLDPKALAEFKSIIVSGFAATAVLELFSGDQPVYTDMLSLYKFDDGWKIVSKIFYAYPRKTQG